MRTGCITRRKRREKLCRMLWKTVAALAAAAAVLGVMATPKLRGTFMSHIEKGMRALTVFAPQETAQADVTLPRRTIAALQLAAFDSGEKAAQQAQRLSAAGVPVIVWQREQMRVICAAALTKDALIAEAAGGREAYVIEDTMPRVDVRLTAGQRDLQQVVTLVQMPDALLMRLGGEKQLSEAELTQIIGDAEAAAQSAASAYPENALYTQLAQSLVSWCAMMKKTAAQVSAHRAQAYGAAMVCTLCRELRMALTAQYQQSEASTASAQRTPSTAADVMPPA